MEGFTYHLWNIYFPSLLSLEAVCPNLLSFEVVYPQSDHLWIIKLNNWFYIVGTSLMLNDDLQIKSFHQDGNFNAMSMQVLKSKSIIGIMFWYMVNETMVTIKCWFRHSKWKKVMMWEHDILWRWLASIFRITLFYHSFSVVWFK